jgi:sulfoxide reductase heme-binding subunit YedZ
VKRPYVTVGFASFLGMIPLALTSNNWSVRRLGGANWQNLHKLTYFVVLGGAIHYLWLYKANALFSEPMLYLTAILVLLGLRTIPRRARVAA